MSKRGKTYIGSSTEEIKSHNDDEDVHQETNPSTDTSLPVETRPEVGVAHTDVRDAPENPTEEAVEQTAHQGQKVGEEGNDFGDDEGENPREGEDAGPRGPAHKSMRGLVTSAFEQAEKDKSGRDRGVENTKEDQGRNHEGEADFFVDVVSEGVKGRSSVVLGAGIAVHF